MTEQELENLIVEITPQASNWENPCESDGYNEIDVFDTCKKLYNTIMEREEWKNLYSEGLQVGISMYKEKYELAVAALKIIADGDPIGVGMDEITEIARKGLGY